MGGFTYGLICACCVLFFSCTNIVYRLEEAQKRHCQTQRILNNVVSMQLKTKKQNDVVLGSLSLFLLSQKRHHQTQRTLNNVVSMQLKPKKQNGVVLGSLSWFLLFNHFHMMVPPPTFLLFFTLGISHFFFFYLLRNHFFFFWHFHFTLGLFYFPLFSYCFGVSPLILIFGFFVFYI